MISKQAEIKKDEILIKFFSRDKSKFFETLNQVKKLDGRLFHSKSKQWTCPASDENISALQEYGFQLIENEEVDEPDNWTEPWNELEINNYPDYLYDEQQEAIRFLEYNNSNGLISDVMGFGKTIEALAYLDYKKDLFPALIVVPATIKRQWKNQYEKFLQRDDVKLLYGKTTYELDTDYSYVINWDILNDWKVELKRINFKCIIGDEVHRISNPKSLRSRAFKKLAKNRESVIALSGTPIKKRPKQFFNILNILQPDEFDDQWNYMQRYCDPKFNGFGWSFDGASHTNELHKKVRNIMLRRTTIKGLSHRQVSVIPLDVKTDRSKYEASLQQFAESTGIDSQQAFSNLKLEAFALKQDFVVRWLKDFIDSDEKILVGTYHRKVIEFLSEQFKDQCRVIYGGIGEDGREQAKNDFIEDENVKILFAQILSAGEGIDGLQHVCSNVAFVEFAFNPTDHDQFEARIWRNGQKRNVTTSYLVADGTIEDDMVKSIDEGRKVFDAVVNGKETDSKDFINYLKEKYTN